eukprot:scaffold12649_cov19-Tisochrysis_lutea.AAC.1
METLKHQPPLIEYWMLVGLLRNFITSNRGERRKAVGMVSIVDITAQLQAQAALLSLAEGQLSLLSSFLPRVRLDELVVFDKHAIYGITRSALRNALCKGPLSLDLPACTVAHYSLPGGSVINVHALWVQHAIEFLARRDSNADTIPQNVGKLARSHKMATV